MTERMRAEVAAHPRRYANLIVGKELLVHDPELGKAFLGIVIALDPLQITWRY